MKRDHDPPRLAHTADDPIVRRAIGAARRDLPSDERMRMLSISLLGRVGGGGSGGAPPDAGASGSAATAGTTAAGSAAGAFAVKATSIVVAMAVAGAAWQALRRPAPVAEPTVPVATLSPTTEVAARPPPTALDPRPNPEASGEVPTYSVDSLPTIEPKASALPAASAEAPGETEIALLHRAQDALSIDPGRALELCATHARSYARSGLSQEREVIAIDALLRLGRRSEAEARADRFAQAYPSSGHRRRIDSLLGR